MARLGICELSIARRGIKSIPFVQASHLRQSARALWLSEVSRRTPFLSYRTVLLRVLYVHVTRLR